MGGAAALILSLQHPPTFDAMPRSIEELAKSASSDDRLCGRVPPPSCMCLSLVLVLTWLVMLHIVLCAQASFRPSPSRTNSVGCRQLNASCLDVILVSREEVVLSGCFESPSSHPMTRGLVVSSPTKCPASTGVPAWMTPKVTTLKANTHLHTQENAPPWPSILAIPHS